MKREYRAGSEATEKWLVVVEHIRGQVTLDAQIRPVQSLTFNLSFPATSILLLSFSLSSKPQNHFGREGLAVWAFDHSLRVGQNPFSKSAEYQIWVSIIIFSLPLTPCNKHGLTVLMLLEIPRQSP